MKENEIGDLLIKIAIEVHREIGPGLYESVYESILAYRMRQKGLKIGRQVQVPIEYDGIVFDEGFRADLIIDDKVIVELKCVDSLGPMHRKQLLTYLKMSGKHLGFLLNFNEPLLKNGIYRVVNKLKE